MKLAKVYLSFLENKIPISDILKIFKSKRNFIRQTMGSKLALKYIPQLQFYFDDSAENAQKISDLIKKIKDND